jgi:C-terminal processing protease CtpA/Prc
MARSAFRSIVSGFLAAFLLLTFPLSAQVPIGFERDRMKMILETVSRDVEKNFYDPSLRGLDWKTLTQQTRQRIEASNSAGEMLTAIFSLVERLKDSHTVFLPPSRIVEARFGFEAKTIGDRVRIYKLDPKGAAAAAGLQRGDHILSINGFTAERSTFDLMMLYFRVLRPVALMEIEYSRGGAPPKKLRVEAKVTQKPMITDLTDIDNIYQLIRQAEADEDEDPFLYGDYEGGVGYLYLPYFTSDGSLLNRLAGRVKNARAVVVDLRGNPGGSVDGLTHFVGFFEPEATVIADMVGRQKTEPMKVKPRKPALQGRPLVILVDSQSASAAEVFAHHFQRTARGVVVGDRTSGRVTVARFYSHQIGQDVVVPYGIQVAIARAVFPDGEELEARGVTPDVPCLPTEEHLREDRDPCLKAAINLARERLEAASPSQ